MSIKTLSQNTLGIRRINITNTLSSSYWINGVSDANTVFTSVINDSANNLYVTGYTSSYGAGGNDAVLIKFNTVGNILWQKTLGGSSDEKAYGITIDSANNIIIIGTTNGAGATAGYTPGFYMLFVAKFDTNGNLVWQKTGTMSANINYNFYGVTTDSSNNIYVVGDGNDRGLLTKLDSNGAVLWQRDPGLAGIGLRDVAIDSSGNNYSVGFFGTYQSQGAGANELYLLKYDTNNNLVWERTLGSASNEYGYGIVIDNYNNIYVTGYTYSVDADSDLLIAKYDTNGTIQWQKALGGVGNTSGYGITKDSSGNVYVIGTTLSGGVFNREIMLTKYTSAGYLAWQRSFGEFSDENLLIGSQSIAVDNFGNLSFCFYNSYGTYVVRVPTDGSTTGNFLNFSYGALTLTPNIVSLTSGTQGANHYQTGLTMASSSFSIGIPTFSLTYTKLSSTNINRYFISTFTGSGQDYGQNVALDSFGFIYVVGYTSSQGSGSWDLLLIKYDNTGVILWQRTLGDGNSNYGLGIRIDPSDNVYVTGGDNGGLLLAKYDINGNLFWQVRLANGNSGNSLDFDSLGNIYIATQYGTYDGQIVKFNPQGSLVWQKDIRPGIAYHNNTGLDLVINSNNEIYMAYRFCKAAEGVYEAGIIKWNTSGSIVGQQFTDYNFFTKLYNSIAYNSSGYVYASGSYNESGVTGIIVGKFNSGAGLITRSRYNISGKNLYNNTSIHIDSRDRIYVAGYNSTDGYTVLMNIDSDLGLISSKKITNFIVSKLIFDRSFNPIMVGYTTSVGGISHLVVIRGILNGTFESYTISDVTMSVTANYYIFGGGGIGGGFNTSSSTSVTTLSSNASTLAQVKTYII